MKVNKIISDLSLKNALDKVDKHDEEIENLKNPDEIHLGDSTLSFDYENKFIRISFNE